MKKFILSFISSVVYAMLLGSGLSQVLPYGAPQIAAIFFVGRTTYFMLVGQTGFHGLVMAGVNKEIWIDKLKEGFYSAYDWLAGVDDWSEWVEYNTLNYTIAGADPTILKNNSTWPIVAAQRTDTNGTVVLDTYDSTTSRVRNTEEIESSINKLESVVKQHRSSLMQEIVKECLWNYSPATAAAGAFAATGANRAAVIGAQTSVAAKIQLADIARAQQELDNREFRREGRVLVLSPYHREDLLAQDSSLQKVFATLKNGEVMDLYGFKIYVTSIAPLYTKSTLAKKAYGAAADNVNDCVASSIFLQTEVMKCMGDVEMFSRAKEDNPDQRADEVGFQMRFKGAPQRTLNFLQMAIVSNRA